MNLMLQAIRYEVEIGLSPLFKSVSMSPIGLNQDSVESESEPAEFNYKKRFSATFIGLRAARSDSTGLEGDRVAPRAQAFKPWVWQSMWEKKIHY